MEVFFALIWLLSFMGVVFSPLRQPLTFLFYLPLAFFLQRYFKKDIVILSYEKIPIPSIGYFNVVLRKRAKP